MRSLISTILFTALLAAGCGRSGSSAATDAVGGPALLGDVSSNQGAVLTDTVGGQNIVKGVSTNDGVVLTRTAIASGPDPASEFDSVRDGEKAQATFSGGDGSSIKGAVVITASSEEKGMRAAYIWLHQHYPGSRLQAEGDDYDDSAKHYSEIKIMTSDGKSRTVYFETTSFWGNGEQ